MAEDQNPNEPEGRQLMVNKRLTKAISAVPRARFQKARPKLPCSKRNEPSSTPVPLKSAAVVGVQNNSAEEKLKSPENILSLKPKSEEKCEHAQNDKLESEKFKTSQNNTDATEVFDTIQVTPGTLDVSDLNESIPKPHVTVEFNQEILEAPEAIDSIARNTEKVESTEVSDRSASVADVELNSENEKLKSDAILTLKTQSEEKSKPLRSDKFVSERLETSKNNLDVPKALDAVEKSKEQDTVEKSKEQDAVENSKEQDAVEKSSKKQDVVDISENISITPGGGSIARSTRNIEPIESSNRLPTTPPAEEQNDVSLNITSTAVTDRASKYPHLTSILSKKRTDPKKDTTHKRRRKYCKGDSVPERDKMTMADLIYWNPTSSDPGLKNFAPVNKSAFNLNNNTPEESHEVDEPEDEEVCSSVPKLIISEDGQINIDQVSLVVSRKQAPELPICEVERNEETTYASFRKRPLTKQWTPKDTFIFYKALSLVGTDFALMEKLLPHRTRRELKLKFKREEKYNIDLVNKAMYESQPTFDGNDLEEHIANLNSVSEDLDLDCLQENNRHPVKEKKPRGRKRKEVPKVVEDGEQCPSPAQLVNDAENKKPRRRKRKMVKVLSDDSEPHSSPTKSVNGAVSDTLENIFTNEVRNKRKRKKRKLPDGFVNIDEIEDISDIFIENSNLSDSVSEPSSSKSNELDNSDPVEMNSETSVPPDESSLDKICDGSTNIQIICLEDIEKDSTLVNDSINQLKIQPEASASSEKSTNIQIICLEKDNIEECSQLSVDSINLLKTAAASEDSDDFQIVCIDDTEKVSSVGDETVFVPGDASSISLTHPIRKVVEQSINASQTSVNENDCVIKLIGENPDSNEIASFTHVMANEVVTSLEPAIKRKRKVNTAIQKYKKAKVVPKIHRKINETKESSQSLQPSSFNYTPLEDSLMVNSMVKLEFSPKSNIRTYSKSPLKSLSVTQSPFKSPPVIHSLLKSPSVSEDMLINSLQKPLSTPEHSNTLLTSLNVTKSSQPIAIALTPEHSNSLLSSLNATQNQSFAIPLTSESNPNAPSDSVLFLTKSQNKDNVIHMFMYKNPIA